MKIIILTIISLLMLTNVNGDNVEQHDTDAVLHGHVIDKNTQEHLAYATISIKGTSIGIAADATGHFTLTDLPIGTFVVEVGMVGYKPIEQEATFKKNSTIEIKFELEEDNIMLDQIVVSASRTEVKRRNSPSLVNVVNNKTFEIISAPSLAEGLAFQPGVRVENNCQNCGFNQVRINGLDGHYSQILMDSRPVFSALAGVYGLEQIPANMIDRVEVVRGGGSALFGSSAIGGTINIITKDPTYNSAEVAHTTTSIGVTGALDENTTLNTQLVAPNGKAGLMIYAQNRNRDGYDHNGDGFTEIPIIKTKTIGLRGFLRTSNYSKLTVQYHGTTEFRRGGDLLDRPAHEANIAEMLDHEIHGGDISFDLFSAGYKNHLNAYVSFRNTNRESYYGVEKDLDAYGITKDLVLMGGLQYTRKWDKLWFMPAEFVAGAEYNYNDLEDIAISRNHEMFQKVHNVSVYAQNEWRNDMWGILIGARVDKHNFIDKPIISPRLNFRFNPNENLNFRASYSTGFRAPQAYDEDLHIGIVGGEPVVTVLVDGLKPEFSQSVSVSADLYKNFEKIQTNLLIEGFYTYLDDVFALRSTGRTDPNGAEIQERYNASGATVMGVNIEAKAYFGAKLDFQVGMTLQKSEYKEALEWSENPDVPTEKRMFRSPNTYGYFTATYKPIRPMLIALTGTYTGKMLVQHMEGSGTDIDKTVVTPQFFDMNAKVSYDFKIYQYITLQINVGIRNIFNAYQDDFDTGVARDGAYMYGPALPRSIFAGVKISF